jgi:uncharacterized membrane protein YfcA
LSPAEAPAAIELALWFGAFAIGTLIGATGIGGVALAPVIHSLTGAPLEAAIAIAMACFIFSGVVGTLIFAHFGAIDYRQIPLLAVVVAAAAFAGTLLLPSVSEAGIRLALAVLMVLAGLHGLHKVGTPARQASSLSLPRPGPLIGIGGITGVGSALTGTGGPVILVPILLLLGTPSRTAVGLAQVVQIPIGLSATAAHHLNGMLEPLTVLPVAVAVAAGVAVGALVAHHVPTTGLRVLLSCVLVFGGLAFAI